MSRGIHRERQIRDQLRNQDWIVIRAAGSLGDIDLVALKAGKTPMLIEVKSDVGSPWVHFGPEKRAKLSLAAEWAGATAWVAWWPPNGKLAWIAEADWPNRPPVPLKLVR